MPVKPKIQALLSALSKGVYEREEVIRLALLSALAGESIFLLGPPGVAKSLVARRLKFAFQDGNSFEYLMSKFSTPDEIFGPVSIKKLKDEDKYERLTEKYLPNANIVFLDEIWKAGPAIQNALLTILNERIYRNGEQEIEVNVRGIISASNEVPTHSEGVEALWDRFLVRYYMTDIKNSRNFISMITATEDLYADNVTNSDKISTDEYVDWQEKIDLIQIPEEVLHVIQWIKLKLEEINFKAINQEDTIAVYDRRWKKIVRLLRTSAFLNDRPQVDLMDCFLIAHCLWSKPTQWDTAMQIVSEAIRKHGYSIALNLQIIKQELQDFENEVEQETKIKQAIFVDELMTVENDYLEIQNIRNYFEGNYIKKSDFIKLSLENQTSISLYDTHFALTNRLNARLGSQENQIDIFYNAQILPFALKTKKVERPQIIHKKPHPLVAEHWNERIQTMLNFIIEQEQKVVQNAPEALNHLKNNLFVPSKLSEIVEANRQESLKTLQTLRLRTEKLAFYYQNI